VEKVDAPSFSCRKTLADDLKFALETEHLRMDVMRPQQRKAEVLAKDERKFPVVSWRFLVENCTEPELRFQLCEKGLRKVKPVK